uniref:Candidate secreted effector n=1 Tax=Meloidogyne incognita TaxID=6306 RepID=A0A914NXX8_MELIC
MWTLLRGVGFKFVILLWILLFLVLFHFLITFFFMLCSCIGGASMVPDSSMRTLEAML